MEEFVPIVSLSLSVSLAAAGIAGAVGIPVAAFLAVTRFPGRRVLVLAMNALVGMPPVVVGFFLYLLLAQGGPLGRLGWLFTPLAMILAQSLLAAPVVAALAHRRLALCWSEYGRTLQAAGAGRWAALPYLFAMCRGALLLAVLAGFGRVLSELGATLLVAGAVDPRTRGMSVAIYTEVAGGNQMLAICLALVLAGISLAIAAMVLGHKGGTDGGVAGRL